MISNPDSHMDDDVNRQVDTDRIDVAYVAHLARLYLSEDEVSEFQGQLEGVLGYVRKISQLDLSGIEPTSHAQLVQNVFRSDKVRPGLDHEVVMENAPVAVDGQYCVPKIVE